jgi:hypothetical protein
LKTLRAALLPLVFGLSLNATTIHYNTDGAFTGGTVSGDTDFITFTDGVGDDVTITFNFDTGDSATSTGSPTNANFGTFVTTVSNSSATVSIPQTTFILTITQTAPGASGSTNSSPVMIDGYITAGTISGTSSTVDVVFSPATATVTDTITPGTATYDMFVSPIVPPSTGGGTATLAGSITYAPDATTPEPATFAMVGAGLIAAGLVTRRRRRQS